MKNLPLILSIIALAASGFLFFNNSNSGKGAGQVDAQSAGKIAYVNMDSLQTQYTFYVETQADIAKKQQEKTADIQQRRQKLAVKDENFRKQYGAGLLSANEAKLKQQNLEKELVEYQQYEKSVQDGLISYSQEKQSELFDKINGFLKEYNEKKGYSYIFQHGLGSIFLVTDETHDITGDVIAGLNEAYKKEKEAANGGGEEKAAE